MPSINVNENDFQDVALAAADALERGHVEMAKRLDKLARKINAALTSATVTSLSPLRMNKQPIRWQDMPSTLGDQL